MLVTSLLLYMASAGLGSALAWEMLGEKQVDFGNDNDRIQVGKKDGRYREIQLRVNDAAVEIHSMVVTFGNGETFAPNLRQTFQPGSQSRAIDLPGDRKRTITNIRFKYESMETSDRNNQRGRRSEIDDAIRTLEGAGYRVTPPQYSDRGRGDRRDSQYSDRGRGDRRDSQKATVQVWGQ
jgi:hypothetical protein